MGQRSDWKGILASPLPAPGVDDLPPASGTVRP
jgi:hypothetical protein